MESVGNCAVYADSKISVNDIRTDGNETTEIYIPIPVTVQPGEKLKVTISGSSWGTSDFRIWTTPSDAKSAGDYVLDNNVYLNPTKNEDGSFTGTVELTAKDKACSYITLKPGHGTKITKLVISEVKVDLVK